MSGLNHLGARRWPVNPGPGSHQAVSAVIASRTWTRGRCTLLVESGLCVITGAAHAVAFSSGTAAVHAALLAHGLRRGDLLHTPALGSAGTVAGAAQTGARMIYSDVDRETGNSLDPYAPPGQFVLIPDLHGVPHAMRRRHVITDARQSLGSLVDGHHVGAIGTHCWSFAPHNVLSAPDGGAVTTDDEGLAQELRQLRDYGAQRGPSGADSVVTIPGYNWHPSELSMALVAEQLSGFRRTAERARLTGAQLRDTLKRAGLWHQETRPGVEPAFTKVRAGLLDGRAGLLRQRLHSLGIPTHDWAQPLLPDHPVFAVLGGEPVPNARDIAAGTFCLGTETCPPWTWTSYETSLVCHTIELIMESL
jgi:perosamine synthetase